MVYGRAATSSKTRRPIFETVKGIVYRSECWGMCILLVLLILRRYTAEMKRSKALF